MCEIIAEQDPFIPQTVSRTTKPSKHEPYSCIVTAICCTATTLLLAYNLIYSFKPNMQRYEK